MARRYASSSLRRRFAWTLGSVAVIVTVGLVSWVVYHASKQQLNVAAKQQAQAARPANGEIADPAQEVAVHKPEFELPGPKPVGNFVSERYGYRLALEGTPWTRWENLSEVVREADFGALLSDRARVLVIPVVLGNLQPHPEALSHALLARMGIAYPSDPVSRVEPVERDGATGHAIHLIRDVAGVENVYRVLVLRRGDFAYLVAAWLSMPPDKSADEPLAAVEAALSQFRLDEVMPAAPHLDELSDAQRWTHGAVYNDLGRFAYDTRDYSMAVDCFRRAFALQPKDHAILGNLISAYVELEQYREALAVLQQNIDQFPDQLDLWAGRAFLLAKVGDVNGALAAYSTLFAAGYRAEVPFLQYATLLADHDRQSEALVAVEQFLQLQDSFSVRRLQAKLYRKRGQYDDAIDILSGLQENRPFLADLAYDLAECYYAAERYHDAIDVCRQLLENRYETAHTFLLQARSQYALKWYPQAKSSLELALKREPTNKQAKELRKAVLETLGEGGPSGLSEAIEPVSLPEELETPAVSKSNDEQFHSYGAYFLQRHVAIEFDPGQTLKQTDYRSIRVLDSSGIVRFSTIQVPFNPQTERLYVNHLRVRDDSGRDIASGKPTDVYVIDGRGFQRASPTKLVNIPVPGLQLGCTIELVFSRMQLAAPQSFPYRIHRFSEDVPIASAALYVRAPSDAFKAKASAGVESRQMGEGLAWLIERPAVYRFEPLQPAADDFLPHVVLNDASAAWEPLVRDYLESIADRLTTDKSVEALAIKTARDGTATSDSEPDRADDSAKRSGTLRPGQRAVAAACVRAVQRTLTYKAIEFGRSTRVPNPTSKVLKNKYGDCKDHSLLLWQMLRANGIEAYLALANFARPVDPDLPSLDQFNHMLVYVPGYEGGRFFDATDKTSDIANLKAPLDLGGANVLVLDAERPRLVQAPKYDPHSSRIESVRKVRISDLSDAVVEETVTVTGHHAAFLRSTFREVPAAERAAVLQEELGPNGGLQIQSLEIDDLQSLSKPLVFRLTYILRGRFHFADNSLLGPLPALWERMYLAAQPVAGRRSPFVIEYPLDIHSEIELAAPERYQIVPPPASGVKGESPFADWQLESTSSDGRLQLQFDFHLPAGRYPAEQYGEYEAALEQAVGVLAKNIALKHTD